VGEREANDEENKGHAEKMDVRDPTKVAIEAPVSSAVTLLQGLIA